MVRMMDADKVRAKLSGTPGGCVVFDGPPRIWFEGRMQEMSRVLYKLACGAVPPKGVQLCRTCDNPNCIAPSHRKLGGGVASKRGRKRAKNA